MTRTGADVLPMAVRRINVPKSVASMLHTAREAYAAGMAKLAKAL